MARPSKLTPEIKKQIGENVALGLSYALAAYATGITYQILNQWLQRNRRRDLGNILNFIIT